MSELYSGVKVHTVKQEIINSIYSDKKIPIFDKRHNWYENLFVVLKDESGGSQSALGRVKNGEIHLIPDRKNSPVQGIVPKNKEQQMALDVLLDDDVKVVVLTGRAGTGKTLLTLSTAVDKIQQKQYDRIILTRPMSWVGKHSLGALPGDVNEKFGPYLENYMCNLQYMLGGSKTKAQDLIQQCKMEFLPLQLIRGASWHNAIVIADEVQTLDYHEMVTLGTRVGEGSKIVIMGDLAQRDEKIAKDKTGIHKFVNDERSKMSNFVASIELLKSERSKVAELFADVFEAK